MVAVMRRFFVDPAAVGEREIVLRSRTDYNHISKVLRLKQGDSLFVSDSVEWEYHTEIRAITPDAIFLSILDKQRFSAEPRLRITLFQGVPKQGKMETVIQKSVELGVHAVVPVYTARSVSREKGHGGNPFQKEKNRANVFIGDPALQANNPKWERWRRVAAEAVKQCGRGVVPAVEEPISAEALSDRLGAFDLVLFPYENEREITIKDVLRDWQGAGEGKTVAIIIGPEGGFSEREAEALVSAGGRACSLGRTILRTETAGPAAIAMAMYELEL
jgi:16S rRNA (uracil1498-N3)-methyltransferase